MPSSPRTRAPRHRSAGAARAAIPQHAAAGRRARVVALALVSVLVVGLGTAGALAVGGAFSPEVVEAAETTAPAPSATPEETPTPTPTGPYREGLALTPPMGWNSWNYLRCNDLSEAAVKSAADAIVARGLAASGYEYVVVDDCWQAGRDANGVLIADPVRFPSGMKALGDYLHGKGLKFGIYAVPGSVTCANYWDKYPVRGIGSLGYEALDARTFADWGVDFLKYDWCRADINDGMTEPPAFAQMEQELVKTGRDIVLSISEYGESQPWTWAPGIANMWRTSHDLHPNWKSLADHINAEAGLSQFARPGAWNDPDMLQLANGLGPNENVTQMAMWCILAAPLFIGTDPAALDQQHVDLLTNPELLAIDQDPLGKQGDRLRDADGIQVWGRTLSDGSYAVAFWNTSYSDLSSSVTLAELGLSGTYTVRDTVNRVVLGTTSDVISSPRVGAHGTALLRLDPVG